MVKRKLYLDDVIKRDNVEFGSNNMIISPVGSGKTYFIKNSLHEASKQALMLVSTTSLKESLLAEEGYHTTATVDQANSASIMLMTYAEFGSMIAFDNAPVEKYENIFCDEIHSLFDYFSYKRDYALTSAIKYLINKQEGKNIYYFTATIEKIEDFKNRVHKGVLDNMSIYDYREEKDIVRYTSMFKEEFVDIHGMMEVIDKLEDFGYHGEKGIIFNERIEGMKKIEDLLVAKGYKVATIWSINNDKHEMSDEQLSARKTLLEEGIIPEQYDFVIINGAMREGWNLLDNNVELALLNTLDKTNAVQALGRVRKNISMVAVRVKGETSIETRIMRRNKSTKEIDKILGQELTTADKDDLANRLEVKRDNGRLVKWRAISDAIKNNGYEVTNKSVRRDGRQLRVSVVTKK